MSAPSQRDDAVTVVAHEIGPFGGMESQLERLVEQLLERGVEVTAIGRRVDLAPHPSLQVIDLPGPSRPFPLAYLWFFIAGTWAVARWRRGAVYSLGAIVLNRVDARKVPFCHVAWAESPYRRSRASRTSLLFRLNASISAALSRAAERVVYRPSRSGSLVAMSTSGARDLERQFPAMGPAIVIPNGVDLDRFRPDATARPFVRDLAGAGDEDLVAVFLGGDWRRKGLPQLIGAIGSIPRWRLIVAGSGDEEAMARLAESCGAGERVTFAGRVDDPERLLAGADALAMPSLYEPWGNAVLEACACGLPVVVTATDGVLDFVDEDRTGLLVEPEIDSVARALHRLEDPMLRSRLGAAARERASAYSYAGVADAYVSLFQRLERRPRDSAAATPR